MMAQQTGLREAQGRDVLGGRIDRGMMFWTHLLGSRRVWLYREVVSLRRAAPEFASMTVVTNLLVAKTSYS